MSNRCFVVPAHRLHRGIKGLKKSSKRSLDTPRSRVRMSSLDRNFQRLLWLALFDGELDQQLFEAHIYWILARCTFDNRKCIVERSKLVVQLGKFARNDWGFSGSLVRVFQQGQCGHHQLLALLLVFTSLNFLFDDIQLAEIAIWVCALALDAIFK